MSNFPHKPTWEPGLNDKKLADLLIYYDYLTEESRKVVAQCPESERLRMWTEINGDFYAHPDIYPSEMPYTLDVNGWKAFHGKCERICHKPQTKPKE